jgi:GST-like protein
VKRLHWVLEKRLSESAFLAGPDYTIADIATFAWVRNPERRGIALSDYPSVKRWHDAIAARPAVQRGVAVLADRQRKGPISEAERDVLFGKTQFAVR